MNWMKTNSIKFKITLVFSLAFLIMLVTLVLVNHFFMDDFYRKSNERKMTEIAMEFEKKVNLIGPQKAMEELRSNNGVQVFIFNNNYKLLPGSMSVEPWENFNTPNIKELHNNAINKNNMIYFDVIGEEGTNNYQIVLTKILESNDILLLTKKMGLAKEVTLLNFRFMLLTSIFIYIFALILIIIISSKLSKPIINIKNKAEKMSQLDFSEKIDVKSLDEVGLLSTSVNKLSDKLSHTIDELSNVNIKLNAELEKKTKLEKMRRRFVSDVSHELKNPISMIRGYADGLVHNIPKTEEEKNYYYQVIVEEAIKMNKLIIDLLDLSSYESGSFTLNKEDTDLGQIIKDSIEKFSKQINEKDIKTIYNASENTKLYGDTLRLGQVVVNLLMNAIKYTDNNGIIKVEISEEKNNIKLAISNTGPLIPQDELDHIWNSFYQVNNSKQGNGLGLAIVKSIVDLHGGCCRAYVEDEFNCFEVILGNN